MSHGQFERGVGEVMGAELVVIHTGLSQDPFGHELLQECGVSRLFEHRSQPERQLFSRRGQPIGGDLRELGTARITQSKELGLGKSHVTDRQGGRFGRARRRQEEGQACQDSLLQGVPPAAMVRFRIGHVTASRLPGHSLFRHSSCCTVGLRASFGSC